MYGYAELNMYSTLQKMKCKNEKHDIGQRNNNNNMCVVVVVVVVVVFIHIVIIIIIFSCRHLYRLLPQYLWLKLKIPVIISTPSLQP